MTIEQTIKKAITEGRYKEMQLTHFLYLVNNGIECIDRDIREVFHRYTTSEIFLDPLFWKSLGRAMGWGRKSIESVKQYAWKSEWHRFIDHLAEGKSAEEFFKTLK